MCGWGFFFLKFSNTKIWRIELTLTHNVDNKKLRKLQKDLIVTNKAKKKDNDNKNIDTMKQKQEEKHFLTSDVNIIQELGYTRKPNS